MSNIVVLEDDVTLLELYSDVLTHADYNAIAFSRLDELQAYFETATADLIIADLRLGATTAEETIEALKTIHLEKQINVILISAQMMIYEAQCRQVGFTHLLTKPFPNRILIQMVEQVLQDNAP